MKRLITILFFLSLIATGTYYFYKTNKDFKNFVADLLPKEKKSVDSLTTHTPTPSPTPTSIKEKKSTKKKIPKTLKPDEFHSLDEYAKKTPKQYEKDIHTLSDYLIKPATTDMEKVRVIFTWVATHVRYDADAFNSGNYPDYSAENVLSNKKAICEGYGNLFKALCEAAGFETEKIIGYAKGYGYNIGDKFTETDHAWNAVKIDNKWRLFDATWGSGYGTKKNGKLVSTLKFEPYWFNVNPKAFIFTHLPLESKWQMTGGSLTLDKYEMMPYLTESFFKLGFNPDKIYSDAVSGKVKEFVKTYSYDFPIKVIQLPYSQNLNRQNEIKFEIQSDYAEDIALIDDNSWLYFTKENNVFTISHKPTGKNLQICIKINWFDKNFSTIVKYSVTDNGSITALK
ncbi:MAG: hypothetical protein A3F72_03305 [Bacteroidetes bacterium RIFCSPLOWO2_12_FULL_35_15]|nr:MAG: hypothetical protein A3F72_03305 [Bacteroidetes bacterium RIFCSPLOWO2_12_FULL_35_15]